MVRVNAFHPHPSSSTHKKPAGLSLVDVCCCPLQRNTGAPQAVQVSEEMNSWVLFWTLSTFIWSSSLAQNHSPSASSSQRPFWIFCVAQYRQQYLTLFLSCHMSIVWCKNLAVFIFHRSLNAWMTRDNTHIHSALFTVLGSIVRFPVPDTTADSQSPTGGAHNRNGIDITGMFHKFCRLKTSKSSCFFLSGYK